MRYFSDGLLHLLFPRLCEGCRKPLSESEEVICISCELQLSQTHYHHIPDNETALRLAGRIPFVHATSLAYYNKDSLLQHLIHRLKYADRKSNGRYLGREIGKAISKWGIELIVPVPLHRKKELLRGYNQSMLIAEGISSVSGVPIAGRAVIRSRHTDTQTDKNREERISNVSGAFEVVLPREIAGKHILLTDDVLTTGATIEACATAVLKVPGVSVSLATAGIATN
jgi:ComF family protein